MNGLKSSPDPLKVAQEKTRQEGRGAAFRANAMAGHLAALVIAISCEFDLTVNSRC